MAILFSGVEPFEHTVNISLMSNLVKTGQALLRKKLKVTQFYSCIYPKGKQG